jgi:2-iminobutanoate/2-iminopropanoate deaminase
MEKTAVKTGGAPEPFGPYSQAIIAGDFVFCSGQIALDPRTGALVTGDIEHETKRIMENLSAVLAMAGSSLEKVVKTTIFLCNMEDFARVNDVYGSFFKDMPPARSTVQVTRLPRDVHVEIECIALKK